MIRNLLKPDYRFSHWKAVRKAELKRERQRKWQRIACYAFLWLLAVAILVNTLKFYSNKPLLDPRGSSELVPLGVGNNKPEVRKLIKSASADETPFCYDPITCIRDVGEELGVPNKDILTMIRLANCESKMNPQALNKNTNGTFDVGLLQINDVHGKRISRQDRMNFEKNIRFAYKLYQEQHGFQAWSCYKYVR